MCCRWIHWRGRKVVLADFFFLRFDMFPRFVRSRIRGRRTESIGGNLNSEKLAPAVSLDLSDLVQTALSAGCAIEPAVVYPPFSRPWWQIKPLSPVLALNGGKDFFATPGVDALKAVIDSSPVPSFFDELEAAISKIGSQQGRALRRTRRRGRQIRTPVRTRSNRSRSSRARRPVRRSVRAQNADGDSGPPQPSTGIRAGKPLIAQPKFGGADFRPLASEFDGTRGER